MQLWPYQESDCFESAIHEDFHLLLQSFYMNSTSVPSSSSSSTFSLSIDLTFSSFKRFYKDLFFHELHNLCPLRIHEEIYFQQIVRHILLLFHHPSPEIEIFTPFPLELRQALWNIGIFFLLYCFYGTRCEKNHQKKFRIRVSPEEWYEMILAYQRLKSLGNIGLQAIKVFHKLQADSAFHFSSYSGGPSLYRISKMIEDIRLHRREQSRSDFPQYLHQIIEGNEFISSHCEEMRSLVMNDDDNNSSHRFIFPSSSTPLDAILLGSDDDGCTRAVNMDKSMKDFFGLSDGDKNNDNDNDNDNAILSEESSSDEAELVSRRGPQGESSTLSLLEQLERETVEVLGQSNEGSEMRKKSVSKKARTNVPRVRRTKPQVAPRRGETPLGFSSENDPLRLLEQLEKDSMELLGTDPTSRGGGKSRKRSESVKTKQSPEVDTNHIASEILTKLEAEVGEFLEEIAAPKSSSRNMQRKKTDETKKVRRKEPKSKRSVEDKDSSTVNVTLSLLEQLERETMEVLSGEEIE